MIYKKNVVIILALIFLFFLGACSAPPKKTIFYPHQPSIDPPRYQWLTVLRGDQSLKETNAALKFLIGDYEGIFLKKAHGIAVHNQVIYVVDSHKSSNNIMTFDLKTEKVNIISSSRIRKPLNIAIDDTSNKFISDPESQAVIQLDARNKYVKSFKVGKSFRPVAVAVKGNTVYVSDVKSHKIYFFDKKSGKITLVIGNNNEVTWPMDLAISSDNYLYVADMGKFKTLKFSLTGELVKEYGDIGSKIGQFARPKGVDIDSKGFMYTVDSAFQNAQVFNQDGKFMMPLARDGGRPQDLSLPAKVLIDYTTVPYFQKYAAPGFELEYIVFISSQGHPDKLSSKVGVYGFGKMAGRKYSD